jgi:hypothetical protein
MSELTEDLRGPWSIEDVSGTADGLMHDAADHIEKLEADKLQLTAALERLASDRFFGKPHLDGDWESEVYSHIGYARAALEIEANE